MVSVLILSVVGFIGWGSYVIISRYISSWTTKFATKLNKDIGATVKVVIAVLIGILVIRFSLSPLSFLEPYNLDNLFLIVQILLTAYAVSKIAGVFIDWLAGRTAPRNGKSSNHLMSILKKVVTVAIFIVAFIIILNSFEIQGALESTLVGVGVGSVAIAFALQSTLSDFFSAFYIYFDHPFEIGDFIGIGEHLGTVKNIGIRTTRLQLLQGEELVIPNKEVTSSNVRNFRKLKSRRVVFKIGVTYDTSNEKIKKIPPMIVDIIKNVKGATPQFVNFNEFGEYSLKFFISYYVNSPEYVRYLEVQQEINLAIREAFEREGIELAYLKNAVFLKS
ncbi:MAG: mechanosensitive ion channel family protein [Candidatus Bathyarchaeota archaeon]|nr:mechanosensitive ion channel family protein [Candidatus Termiticorpusculum sp.]